MSVPRFFMLSFEFAAATALRISISAGQSHYPIASRQPHIAGPTPLPHPNNHKPQTTDTADTADSPNARTLLPGHTPLEPETRPFHPQHPPCPTPAPGRATRPAPPGRLLPAPADGPLLESRHTGDKKKERIPLQRNAPDPTKPAGRISVARYLIITERLASLKS